MLVDATERLVALESFFGFFLEPERVEVDQGRNDHRREELVDGHRDVGVGVAGVNGDGKEYSSGNCWRQVLK